MKTINVKMTEFYDVTGTDSTPRTMTARVHKSHMTNHLDSLGASFTLGQIRACAAGKVVTVNGWHGPVTVSAHY